MKKTNEIEYIFDLIINEFDLILFNDTQESLLNFRKKFNSLLDTGRLVNMFHNNTLVAYDTSLRLFANILFEKIPEDKNLVLEHTPEFDEFTYWFGSLEFDDFILMCFYFSDQNLLELKTDEDMQFIINVFITNKEMSNAESNTNN